MKDRKQLQIERNRLNELFKSLNASKRDWDTVYCLGALHAMEWMLNPAQQPISQFLLFKYEQENKPKISS